MCERNTNVKEASFLSEIFEKWEAAKYGYLEPFSNKNLKKLENKINPPPTWKKTGAETCFISYLTLTCDLTAVPIQSNQVQGKSGNPGAPRIFNCSSGLPAWCSLSNIGILTSLLMLKYSSSSSPSLRNHGICWNTTRCLHPDFLVAEERKQFQTALY